MIEHTKHGGAHPDKELWDRLSASASALKQDEIVEKLRKTRGELFDILATNPFVLTFLHKQLVSCCERSGKGLKEILGSKIFINNKETEWTKAKEIITDLRPIVDKLGVLVNRLAQPSEDPQITRQSRETGLASTNETDGDTSENTQKEIGEVLSQLNVKLLWLTKSGGDYLKEIQKENQLEEAANDIQNTIDRVGELERELNDTKLELVKTLLGWIMKITVKSGAGQFAHYDDLLTHCYEKIDRFDPARSKPTTFIELVVKGYLKREKSAFIRSQSKKESLPDSIEIEGNAPEPWRVADHNEEVRRVFRLIEGEILDPTDKRILLSRFGLGGVSGEESNRELGKILNIPSSSVQQGFDRAIRKLRKELG